MNPVTKSQWSKPLKTIRGVNHLLKKSSGVNHSNPGLILTRHQIPCSVKRAGATMDSDPMCRIFSLKCNKITTRGDNLFKITGFDPHPSSDTMLRQKSRRHHGYGSYVPHIPIILKNSNNELSSNCYNFNFSYIFHSAYPPHIILFIC